MQREWNRISGLGTHQGGTHSPFPRSLHSDSTIRSLHNMSGGGRAPISIGIQPQIALYSLILGGTLAVAAYTERYRRDQDEIDDRLKQRYYANMQEQHAKSPQITQTIRGQDVRLDDAMNKWVWGGKASVGGGGSGNGGGGKGNSTGMAAGATLSSSSSSSDEDDSGSSSDEDGLDSRSSSSSEEEEEPEEDAQLSKKERKQRRKERKRKRLERRKKRLEEMKRLETERQQLVIQSVAAGAAVGAVAVAASIFLSSRK